MAAGLTQVSGIGVARTVADVDAVMALWAGRSATSLTLHLGTGFKTASEGRRLVAATLAASDRCGVTVLVETHRATLLQDPARALALLAELPFVVELLPSAAHYARTVDRGDGPEEEVDRWVQADVLWEIASRL